MHLLTCPDCQSQVPVAPARAGEQIPCPSCEAVIQVPKLGELRNLPRQEAPVATTPKADQPRSNVAFASFFLLCVLASMVTLFCGTMYLMSQAPVTTESFLADRKVDHQQASPADMVMEFNAMEERSLDVRIPYSFQTEVDVKQGWRNRSLFSAAATSLLALCTLGIGVTGNRKSRASSN
ncbi:MAG: hypothetical protein CBB71_14205 [Rhodopirellula sp. TMED11]|nr:MAG: hypothetical protein CBB71_14205 [Rhodopirellula sp. TMED11]